MSDITTTVPNQESPENLLRFKCVCAYDGTDFCGWQSQKNKASIQDFIEDRLEKIFKEKIRIHGSGRTDAGVHADAQVFHFDANWKHSDSAMLSAMRAGSPEALQILSAERVDKDFHARYSAKGKMYIYKICENYASPKDARYVWSLGGKRLDLDAFNNVASALLGTHDFTSFSANRGTNAKENTVKTLLQLEAYRENDIVTVTTRGSGYMYKMVRMLVGSLVDASLGKFTKANIENILSEKERKSYGFQTAPAKGLTLHEVYY